MGFAESKRQGSAGVTYHAHKLLPKGSYRLGKVIGDFQLTTVDQTFMMNVYLYFAEGVPATAYNGGLPLKTLNVVDFTDVGFLVYSTDFEKDLGGYEVVNSPVYVYFVTSVDISYSKVSLQYQSL